MLYVKLSETVPGPAGLQNRACVFSRTRLLSGLVVVIYIQFVTLSSGYFPDFDYVRLPLKELSFLQSIIRVAPVILAIYTGTNS